MIHIRNEQLERENLIRHMLKIVAEYDKKKSEEDEKKALSMTDAKLKKRAPPNKKKEEKKPLDEEVEIPPPIRYLDPVEI